MNSIEYMFQVLVNNFIIYEGPDSSKASAIKRDLINLVEKHDLAGVEISRDKYKK